MILQDKYAKLIQNANSSSVQNLSITEQNEVLYISGTASNSVKEDLWAIYNDIDPDMRAGDLVLNIEVELGNEEIYEVKPGDSLSKIATKYPGISWMNIFEANKDQIKDPNVIKIGQKLRIPR